MKPYWLVGIYNMSTFDELFDKISFFSSNYMVSNNFLFNNNHLFAQL